MTDSDSKRILERKINRVTKKLATLKEREEHLSKHGHWDMGYLQGQLSVLQDWLDEIMEEEDE
jgi:hypothetical protein